MLDFYFKTIQFEKYMKKAETMSSAGKNYEKILKTAQVRSYNRTRPHENRIQSWTHRMVLGGMFGRQNTAPPAESITPIDKAPTKKFLHWTDPVITLNLVLI